MPQLKPGSSHWTASPKLVPSHKVQCQFSLVFFAVLSQRNQHLPTYCREGLRPTLASRVKIREGLAKPNEMSLSQDQTTAL